MNATLPPTWTMIDARDDGIPQSVRDRDMAECLARAAARRAERKAEEDALAAYGQLLDAKPVKPAKPVKKLQPGERACLMRAYDTVYFEPTTAAGIPSIAMSFKPGVSKRAKRVTRILSPEAARNEWRRLVRLGYRRW